MALNIRYTNVRESKTSIFYGSNNGRNTAYVLTDLTKTTRDSVF